MHALTITHPGELSNDTRQFSTGTDIRDRERKIVMTLLQMVIYIHMKLRSPAGSLSLFGLCNNLCDWHEARLESPDRIAGLNNDSISA